VLTEADCTAAQGVYRGNGTTCQSVDVCAARGACCNPILSTAALACLDTTRRGCDKIGGTWTSGAACQATVCPPPTARGACCRASAIGTFCSVTTQAACATAQGTYKGDATTCSTFTCVGACRCDVTGDGRLTSEDIYRFINGWLAGVGDFNNDGTTDPTDVTDFLSCYQSPAGACVRPTPVP